MIQRTTTTTNASRPRRSRPALRTTTTTVRTARTPGRRRRSRRRVQQQAGSRGNSVPSIIRQYAASVEDPFSVPAVRLGYSTFVNTELYSTFLRTSIITNADGSFAVALHPQIGSAAANTSGPMYTVSGAATNTWQQVDWQNRNLANSLMQTARPISGGVKVMPLTPATASPGVLYAGVMPGMSYAQMSAFTPLDIVGSPWVKQGYGPLGAAAVLAPQDNRSTEFNTLYITGFNVATAMPFACPVIAGIGFPENTSILIQWVVNWEYEPKMTAGSMTGPIGAHTVNNPTLAETGWSADNIIRYARSVTHELAHVSQAAADLASTVFTGQPGTRRQRRYMEDPWASGPNSISGVLQP